jgi:uncharacterized protein YecT (DUF1311 family)
MGAIYSNLRGSLGVTEADDLRSAQRAWIKQRNRACPVSAADLNSSQRFTNRAQCLCRATNERITELWVIMQSQSQR